MHDTTQPLVLPTDFMEKMKGLLGQEWEEFLDCYENGKYQALRFNPLKRGLKREDYPEILRKLNINGQVTVPWAEDAFYYEECRETEQSQGAGICQPGKHPYHEMGLYYIQEPSAMSAAALLAPRPGERVLDLCAAPGGKTTQLASYMKQEGLLVANEIHPARCRILSQNVERMGIANAIVINEDSQKLAVDFPLFFDKILVDAPCSGEGMFRKNPEAAGEWSRQQVGECAKRQIEILHNAARMLRPGGKMVYSTCTFSPEENERTIADFLNRHPEFEIMETEASYFEPGRPEWADGNPMLEKTFRLWPHRLHGEGHYAAVLCRKTPDEGEESAMPAGFSESVGRRKEKPRRDRGDQKNAGKHASSVMPENSQRKSLEDFLQEVCTEEIAELITGGELILFGDQLYRIPAITPSLSGIHVLRAGLHVGTFKKNRFEPSHALALFLGRQDVKSIIDLSVMDSGTGAYFRGETLSVQGEKGWNLVCVDGYSVGWGKRAGGVVKNHYPKGLRK